MAAVPIRQMKKEERGGAKLPIVMSKITDVAPELMQLDWVSVCVLRPRSLLPHVP